MDSNAQYRRQNGWSSPRSVYQTLAWVFVVFFAVMYLGTHAPAVNHRWRPAAYTVFSCVAAALTACLIVASTINPADDHVRLTPAALPRPRDQTRLQHRAIDERNECYYCQVRVHPTSKHCRACNKCVVGFDHHCIWLNNCVGERNYP